MDRVRVMPMALQPGVEKTSSARVPAPPVKPKSSFVRPAEPRGDGAAKVDATELGFGFWDNAVVPDPDSDPDFPVPGFPDTLLLNKEEAEPRNLVGGDTKRFHIKVEDKAAAGRGFVEVDWWTTYPPNPQGVVMDQDRRGAITLLETPAGSGIFVSKGLMLVNDRVDRDLAIHSGISTNHPTLGKDHGGVRKDTMSNFRIRRAGMFSSSVAQYRSRATRLVDPVIARVPVFTNTRRRIEAQVYVLRDTKGGAPSVPLAGVERDLRIVTETYERHGIWLVTKASSADFAVAGTTVRKVGSPIEYTVLEVDPPSKPGNARVNYPEIDEIARTFPPQENTLRLFFVADILITAPGSKLHVLGISFDAGEKLRPPTTLGSSFVRLGRDPYTAAHELGHLLMPKDKREGHYGQRADIGIPGARHVQSINLLGVTAMGDHQHAQHSKRIWDLKDADDQDQIGDLYKSVYLR